jgi:hypothetical protein
MPGELDHANFAYKPLIVRKSKSNKKLVFADNSDSD